ncbi:MAG: ROK family protein [Erysipelotrichaceae bacterium]|jgi:glucokinase|nr:ROK family protein [Erysipelotrichaceae bacterium]
MYRIGIDIGGTQLRAALLDDEMNIIDSFKTVNDRKLSGAENMDRIIRYIKSVNEPLQGIGIGSPGPLDLKRGVVVNPPNLIGWDNFEIVKYMEENTGLKTWLDNDANVAGLAEALRGAGVGYESVVFIGISTGLGGAYVYKGELIHGAHSCGAEFYNMIVNDDRYCHKGANPGSLNETASGTAMQRLASERFGRDMVPKELFEEFYKGDETAKQILEETSEALARGVANIFYTIDPDVYVFGGSVAIHHPWYMDVVKKKAMEYITADDILIVPAKYDDDAGLVGAALLVR